MLELGTRPWWANWKARSLAWAATLAACAAVVWGMGYQVHDADSRLYAAMASDLARTPASAWCAPQWWGHWQRQGLFFEHPPGMLWLGAIFIRAGVPAFCALYWANFAAFFGSMALLWRIGHFLGGRVLGMMAVLGWVLTPAFLQYLVRGDREHPLTFAVLLGLYTLVVVRGPLTTLVLWALAMTLGIFIKGLAGLALLPVAAAYWLFYDRGGARAAQLLAGTLLALGLAAAFDAWYQVVTGASFWENYFAGQVAFSVGRTQTLLNKAGNLLYYTARPLWFGLPLMVAILWGLVLHHRQRNEPLRAKAWVLGLLVAAVFIGGFSLADRRADRYIFPIYPCLALAAAWLWLDIPQGVPAQVCRAVRSRLAWLPYALMLGLIAAVCLKVYIGTCDYPFIRLWRGA